ncbi:hypothetical protein A2U01_0019903 [Trifolium medium]|uniref:Transmembrane protein n=1 Tax=Trifolium medium TaxID=97028 RepID=A0A392NKB4_9FABA|nr:hypothetical protein [Trifolium medium]
MLQVPGNATVLYSLSIGSLTFVISLFLTYLGSHWELKGEASRRGRCDGVGEDNVVVVGKYDGGGRWVVQGLSALFSFVLILWFSEEVSLCNSGFDRGVKCGQ